VGAGLRAVSRMFATLFAMRVDDVPTLLKPAFHAYGYGVGGAMHSLIAWLRMTCRIERRTSEVAALGPRIECIWHEHLPAYFAACLPPDPTTRYVWMNHPIWYMRPIHVLLAWNGVTELALGSTGHDGQAALEKVVAALAGGASTLVAVDGPAGPPHQPKRGALDMALLSGRPLVGISFRYQRASRGRAWDRKWFPAPGSHILVQESAPLYVREDNYELAREQLTQALDGRSMS
jgi:lysophospholipid acyltransferase (LPLAT)-like uncharacterized protein